MDEDNIDEMETPTPIGSEIADDMSESTLTSPPPPQSVWFDTPPVPIGGEVILTSSPPPQDPPPVPPVATADEPEERPKVWNVNAQKWVDPETGE